MLHLQPNAAAPCRHRLRVGVRGAGLAAGIVAPVVVSAPRWVLMDLLLQAQVAAGPVVW